MQTPGKKHLHFVGIGGIGMSGIAEVFLNQGYQVSGSDLAESDTTRRLSELGARIFPQHQADNVAGASVVVISSAVKNTNPEVQEARRLRIPVIPRAEMLGELMRGKTGIAVAGTHGKTTTTSMIATILANVGLDPTVVVGGKVDALGGNAKLGQGHLVVAEADESDGSFLHLPATYVVVTNIDKDHLDHFKSMAAVDEAFAQFVARIPFYGLAAVCGDDAGVRRSLGSWTKPVQTFGISSECDLFAQHVRLEGLGSSYQLFEREMSAEKGASMRLLTEVRLSVPGRHNVLNSLGALAIALRLGIPAPEAARALEEFKGVRRRFEVLHHDQHRNIAVVDDYGHHPTEIAATLAAARAFWKGRILTVFQPHRFSRTRDCWNEFVSVLSEAGQIFVTDVYPAGEDPVSGISSENLVGEIRLQNPEVAHAGSLEQTRSILEAEIREGDLILCLGAGSITKFAREVADGLREKAR